MIPQIAMPPACVVDASVLVKVVLPEDGADVAITLVQGAGSTPPLVRVTPDFAFLECGNILWKWVRWGKLSPALACETYADLRAMPLQIRPTGPLLEQSLVLALSYEISVYDACYVALADLLAIPLVTADAALVRKLSGVSDRAYLLDRLGRIP